MQEIIQKINEKLKPSGWYDQLRIFLESSDFADIILQLKRKVEDDKQRFCPALSKAFRFLEDLKYEEVKAVIFIDYISNRLDQSDGIVLSSGLNNFPDMTPIYLFQSIDSAKFHSANSWVRQGVLILPMALTSRIDGKPHKKVWEPFIMRIIETVNKKYPHAPWLLVGSDTWKYYDDIVSPNIRQIELKNPVDDRQWHQWINNLLMRQKKPVITW